MLTVVPLESVKENFVTNFPGSQLVLHSVYDGAFDHHLSFYPDETWLHLQRHVFSWNNW
jgi:hypothetical protein